MALTSPMTDDKIKGMTGPKGGQKASVGKKMPKTPAKMKGGK